MKRILLITFFIALLFVGCQPKAKSQTEDLISKANRPTATVLQPTEDIQPATTGPVNESSPEPAQNPTTATETQTTSKDGPFTLQIFPPEGWFFSQNRYDDMQAIIYTNYDPEQLKMDENLSSIPINFAVAALAISPLPEDSDPEALHAGLTANLENYGAQDIEGMLLIADQVGVIDLTTVAGVEFISVYIDDLAGFIALRLEGIIDLGGTDRLHAQIWLTWTDTSFVSLFELAHTEGWDATLDVFSETRESIRLP